MGSGVGVIVGVAVGALVAVAVACCVAAGVVLAFPKMPAAIFGLARNSAPTDSAIIAKTENRIIAIRPVLLFRATTVFVITGCGS